jgi:hypothetical protein
MQYRIEIVSGTIQDQNITADSHLSIRDRLYRVSARLTRQQLVECAFQAGRDSVTYDDRASDFLPIRET